mmetsp:Transcript_47540/g.133836  ORF Transcript_47540/g.133836 Transcript_47540/m.133836 type:complete len:221 (-) Transcript_47540:528-1190(-)
MSEGDLASGLGHPSLGLGHLHDCALRDRVLVARVCLGVRDRPARLQVDLRHLRLHHGVPQRAREPALLRHHEGGSVVLRGVLGRLRPSAHRGPARGAVAARRCDARVRRPHPPRRGQHAVLLVRHGPLGARLRGLRVRGRGGHRRLGRCAVLRRHLRGAAGRLPGEQPEARARGEGQPARSRVGGGVPPAQHRVGHRVGERESARGHLSAHGAGVRAHRR